MKSISKKLITFVTIMSLTLCFSVPAFAAEVTSSIPEKVIAENSITPKSNSYNSNVGISSSKWTTIATSTTGFNTNVKILVTNGAVPATTSIRMLGKNGNVVWEEYKAISWSSSRVFWCGSDVYTIQARTNNGVGSATCYPV